MSKKKRLNLATFDASDYLDSDEAIAEYRMGEKYDIGDTTNLAINGYILAKTGREGGKGK